jgi:hypothetical protein
VLYLINDYMGQNTPLLEFSLAQRYESGSSHTHCQTLADLSFPPHHIKQNRGL